MNLKTRDHLKTLFLDEVSEFEPNRSKNSEAYLNKVCRRIFAKMQAKFRNFRRIWGFEVISYGRQRGTALVFAIIIVSFMILVVLSMVLLIFPRLIIIREASNSVAAIYAADSAIEWCIYEIRIAGNVAKPATSGTYWTSSSVPTFTITDLADPISGDDCPLDDAYNHRAVGTYGGVSRAFELQSP